jgi:Mrp family chromosome partitioning ATPase
MDFRPTGPSPCCGEEDSKESQLGSTEKTAVSQNGRPRSNQVHLVLRRKGGVGKSFVSAILGQYFHARKGTLHCFDTDSVNATFAQYRALGTEHINVLRRGAIHDKRFDELIEKICQPG